MHNTGIDLTLLILLCLCLCSNYTPSGISPGKIPAHPSHSAALIAADLQVRTNANFAVKDSESDGELAGGWRFKKSGGIFRTSALSQPRRRLDTSEAIELPMPSDI